MSSRLDQFRLNLCLMSGRQMRICTQSLLLGFCLLMSAYCVFAAPKSPKRPISDAEFLQLFQQNKEISGRLVSPSAIINALRWAQTTAQNNGQLPPGGLRMKDCIVEEYFTFIKIDDAEADIEDHVDPDAESQPENLLLETP